MNNEWIADRLQMGNKSSVSNLVYATTMKLYKVRTDTFSTPFRPSDGRGIKGDGIGPSPDANPSFATAARSAILAPMPTLENNATQPWHNLQPGNVVEISRRFAVMNLALRGIDADFGLEHADTFCRKRELGEKGASQNKVEVGGARSQNHRYMI